jgi:hypothetical protein
VTWATLIEDENATPDRVIECMRGASYVHFTCHGAYDSDAPPPGTPYHVPVSGRISAAVGKVN